MCLGVWVCVELVGLWFQVLCFCNSMYGLHSYHHCKQTMVIQTTYNFGINSHNLIMCGYTKVICSFVVCLQCMGVTMVTVGIGPTYIVTMVTIGIGPSCVVTIATKGFLHTSS